MSQHAGAHGKLAVFRAWIARATSDRRGVAAVEFALVAPLLLAMYFVTMETSQAVETNKKVSRVASMVADLVTQQSTTSMSELEAIMQIGQALLAPYYRSKPEIHVTAIEVTADTPPQAKVFWSRKFVNGDDSTDLTKGQIIEIPATLKTAGSFLIRVTTDLEYRSVIAWTAETKKPTGLMAIMDPINMEETYYLRPRMVSQIACGDCP
jgi:Flp pilus assembly protein TadG